MEDHDVTVYQGGEIKALGEGRVGGYLVRFTTPSEPDLVGDFFTRDTQFGTNMAPPVLYHHGLDGRIKASIIGSSTLTMDDIGLWIEAQLDIANEYAKAIYDRMVVAGKSGWSSGAATVEREEIDGAGWLKTWLIAEASITPAPAEPNNKAVAIKSLATPDPIEIPAETDPQEAVDTAEAVQEDGDPIPEVQNDNLKTSTPIMEQKETPAAEQAPASGVTAAEIKGILAELLAQKAPDVADTPPAQKSAPAVIMDADHWKFDGSSAEDLALTYSVVKSGGNRVSDGLVKALAMRVDSEEGRKSQAINAARSDFRKTLSMAGVKANELNYSTQASYGDEWIGVAYSSDLWEAIRHGTFVFGRIPSFDFPAGAESMVMPLESTDPTWYKVAQATAMGANPGGIATNTVTASKLGTANQTMTLSKFGARTLWTGELSEDSVLPFANQLRMQFATSGAETAESAFLDGDTETGNAANINDIADTPGGTEYWLNVNGARKLALVTNTANSRAGGALAVSDYLETLKLMGGGGRNAIDRSKVVFVVDPSTQYASLDLAEIKTDDVRRAGGTVTDGVFNRVYGVDVITSAHLCKADPNGVGLSNAAGKIDLNTAGNNTLGQILCIRPDQWKIGMRRRMTLESQRIAAADAYELVAFMRFGLSYRDTEAAAISYGITV